MREVDLSKPPYSIDMTGEVDATDTINNAIRSLPDGTILGLPSGRVKISSSILFESRVGMLLQGGDRGTELRWFGNQTDPMIYLYGSEDCGLSYLQIAPSITPLRPLNIAVFCGTKSGSNSTRNKFRSVYVKGQQDATLNYGFMAAAQDGGDTGNDLMTFTDCTVRHYAYAGWAFSNSASQGNSLFNCRFFGENYGRYGVISAVLDSTGTPIGVGGQFYAYAVSGGYNTQTDYYIYATGEHNIFGGILKGSKRFVNLHTAIAPTVVAGVRWEDDNLHSDNLAVVFREPGPLILLGNTIGVPGSGHDVKIYTLTTGGQPDAPGGGFLSIGNYYQITSGVGSPFSGDGVTCSLGDIYAQKQGEASFQRLYIPIKPTANLPVGSDLNDGRLIIEEVGVGDRNLIIYAGSQRFRIDGGVPF